MGGRESKIRCKQRWGNIHICSDNTRSIISLLGMFQKTEVGWHDGLYFLRSLASEETFIER